MKALEIRGLTFSYPDGTRVLSGVDLEVEDGERVALLGANGAGKTTLLLHLIGILRAEEGTIKVGERELNEATLPDIRRRLGMVFQDPNDQLFMPTVAQDVAFGPANYGMGGPQLAELVAGSLAAVGSPELGVKAPHHLSGGERRRAAIATALALEPAMLVLDEPTSGLDPSGRRDLVGLLKGMPATQLVVTHDLPFALELCPRGVVMHGGRMVADGATADLLADRQLMAAHRLELPYGFDPANIAR
jgi:cobalt/nickel transport system ATP-binding protein